MSSVLGLASTAGVVVGTAFTAALASKMADKLAESSLQGTIQGFKRLWDSNVPSSYMRAAAPARVEPFVMIDESVVGLPYIKDVLNTAQRILICNYLLAHSATSNIGGVNVAKRLDRFAPDRSLDVATRHFLNMESSTQRGVGVYSGESYKYGLPIPGMPVGIDRFGDLTQHIPKSRNLSTDYSTESVFDKVLSASDSLGATLDKHNQRTDAPTGPAMPRPPRTGRGGNGAAAGNGAAIQKAIQEVSSLAIGSVVDVKINGNGQEATIPVQVRLRPVGVSSEVISGTFSLQGKSYSLPDRLRALRVGEIDWKDLVFQTDAVKEYRQLVSKDKNNFFRKTYERSNKNFLATMLTGKASIGEMSSIIVTSTDTVSKFERSTGQRMADFKVRQRILEDTLTMLILVIDPDSETLTIYMDSVDDEATYLISDLKMGGKNDKNDLGELMTALMGGRIPNRL